VILFLHNRYRASGGEERAVDDLMWLVREHLGEDAELLQRDSASCGRGHAAAGLLNGGVAPAQVAQAVRRTGARVVHAHNVNPSFGWRALAAARDAGARTVLHLHNYRLVCAVGTCFTQGQDCTRCHGRNTLPGVRRNCRGARAEAATYGAALALWQLRLVSCADVVVVPSAFAAQRLGKLGAPVGDASANGDPPVRVVGHVVRDTSNHHNAAQGRHALVVSRLAAEKGIDVAIAACAAVRLPLVIAGDGPQRAALQALAHGTDTRFTGHVGTQELRALRAQAGLAIVPSRSAETFALAAAEAMAAGLPLAGSAIGALPELCGPEGLVAPGDAAALARAARTRFGDAAAGEAGRRRILQTAAPAAVAPRLAAVYDAISS
jgi:glycosyltransferase involved in cell wall biosynthesis